MSNIVSKIQKWQRHHKVEGRLKDGPAPGVKVLSYKGQQWGCGGNNSGSSGKTARTRNFNRKP